MKTYLTEEEFEALRTRMTAGEASLAISRRVSRQFFTRVANASIVATTGQSMLGRKLVIWLGVIASPLLLLACVGLVIYYFGWFAAVAAPLVGIFWTVFAGLTGDKGDIRVGLVGLAAGLALAAILEPDYGIPLALFTVSLSLHRATYHVAQIWLTQLIGTSYGAYDMLVEHIDVQDPATGT